MLRIIAEQGAHATPMSQIAKEAGVATGTIYHHFKSKEQILNELYLKLKDEFGTLLAQHIDSSLSLKDQFYLLWKLLYNYYIKNPLSYTFVEQVAQTPLISPEVKQQGKKYYQPLIHLFQIGVDQGIFENIDLELMAQFIYGNVITLVQLSLNKELEINDQMITDAITISWNGIVKKNN